MTTIKNEKTGKAIATIETEIGTMTIYYNGTNAEITGETSDGETVEYMEYTPDSLEDAMDVVAAWYSGDAGADWDLTWID